MAGQEEWLAHFAELGHAQMRAARDDVIARMRAREALDAQDRVEPPRPVVLEPGVDIDPLGDQCPAAPRRLAVVAGEAGWHVRCVRSVAACPSEGVVVVVTLRLARTGDGRLWAAWRDGQFERSWLLRQDGSLERVAGTSAESRRKSAQTRAARAGGEIGRAHV